MHHWLRATEESNSCGRNWAVWTWNRSTLYSCSASLESLMYVESRPDMIIWDHMCSVWCVSLPSHEFIYPIPLVRRLDSLEYRWIEERHQYPYSLVQWRSNNIHSQLVFLNMNRVQSYAQSCSNEYIVCMNVPFWLVVAEMKENAHSPRANLMGWYPAYYFPLRTLYWKTLRFTTHCNASRCSRIP